MADIYAQDPNQFYQPNAEGKATAIRTGNQQTDEWLSRLSPEEQQKAIDQINAPLDGQDVADLIKTARETGYRPSMDEYMKYKEWAKAQNHDFLSNYADAFAGLMQQVGTAADKFIEHPFDSTKKLPASVIEAAAQQTRNLYGMVAQSQDPNSPFFRFKEVLTGDGSNIAAEYAQFLDAMQFNHRSADLAEGKSTMIMDKDLIDNDITQVATFVADPAMFIPFGKIATGGLRFLGMGEKMAALSARTAMIRNAITSGALKWGVGAPIEFLGNATRNSIDFAIEKGAIVADAATGLGVNESRAFIKNGLVGSGVASATGLYSIPTISSIGGAYAGSGLIAGVGTGIRALAEQIAKQGGAPSGILNYAERALFESEKAGIQLSKPAKNFLRAINHIDPVLGYAGDMTAGSVHGSLIGGGLGYLSGGEEGMAHGAGAGGALGMIGAGAGRVYADVNKVGLYNRLATQRTMVIEGLKTKDPAKAQNFQLLVEKAKSTGDRHYQAYIDNIITGADRIVPEAAWIVRNQPMHDAFLLDAGIDPLTGKLVDRYSIFEKLPTRKQAMEVLTALRETNFKDFAGNSVGFDEALKNGQVPKTLADKYNALSPEQQSAFRRQLDTAGSTEFRSRVGGQDLRKYYGDLHYAESMAEAIRTHSGDDAAKSAQLKEWLKEQRDSKGRLTQRGKMLIEKLKAEGWADKRGNILEKRNIDTEATTRQFKNSAGFVVRRNSTGQVEININLDQMDKTTVGHELFHGIMREAVHTPDFTNRLVTGLLGAWDANGKQIQQGAAPIGEIQKFFERYIRNEKAGDTVGEAQALKELKLAVDEYKSRQAGNAPSRSIKTLERYAEEFGAYYFSEWLKSKPMDYLFRGGELTGFRGILDSAKEGWLNYWEKKASSVNPSFDFSKDYGRVTSKYFERDGLKGRNAALDALMKDIIQGRGNSTTTPDVTINLAGMTPEAAAQFVTANGISGFTRDKNGNLVRLGENRNGFTAQDIVNGKKAYQLLSGMLQKENQHPTHPLEQDGNRGFKGRLSEKQLDALQSNGIWTKDKIDKYKAFDAVLSGNGSNLTAFGYIGNDMHVNDTDYRIRGVFKNRRIIAHDMTVYVPKNGEFRATMHGLDREVFDVRGGEQWARPEVRALWGDDRNAMEADMFRVLENASRPSKNPDGSINYDRKPTAQLLDNSDGKGAERRDVIHQILGFRKKKSLPYINRPIAEVPLGIRMAITNIRLDRATHMRVENGPRYEYREVNALHDLSRNFQPTQMSAEETPNGRIIRHASGGRIVQDKNGICHAYDAEGNKLGSFKEVADAGRALHAAYDKAFDASVEGKDLPVPHTEVPPSRQAYIERDSKIFGNEDVKNQLIDQLKTMMKDGADAFNVGIQREIDILEREGLTRDNAYRFSTRTVNVKGMVNPKGFTPLFLDYFIGKEVELRGAEYDRLYPLEVKSSLKDNVAQILQDYPNASPQLLKKKLLTYGSRGKKFYTEAQDIGFIKWLDEQTKKTTSVRRVLDPVTGKPTGETFLHERGVSQEGISHDAVMEYLTQHEVKIEFIPETKADFGTTDHITVGGTRTDYEQTSVEVNPEYRHGVQGHYGDKVVHFRNETRLSSEGDKHLYVVEVQAQNSDGAGKITKEDLNRNKEIVKLLEKIKQEGIKNGIYYIDDEYGLRNKINVEKYNFTNDLKNILKNVFSNKDKNIFTDEEINLSGLSDDIAFILETEGKLTVDNLLKETIGIKSKEHADRIINNNSIKKYSDEYLKKLEKTDRFQKEKELLLKNSGLFKNEEYNYATADFIKTKISDSNTAIRRFEKQSKGSPLTDPQTTALIALKGIVRKAIVKGTDNITLTHPMDAPMASHMNPEKSKAFYGKLVPDTWNSWLKRFGIEGGQMNKLKNPTIEKAQADLDAVSGKISVETAKMMEIFKQVYKGENPTVIQKVQDILSETPEKFTERLGVQRTNFGPMTEFLRTGISDNSLRESIKDIFYLRVEESDNYQRLQDLRGKTVSQLAGGGVSTITGGPEVAARVSAEAIDRGFTFKLNDRIKADFLAGKIDIYSQPTQGGMGGESGSSVFKEIGDWITPNAVSYRENQPRKLWVYPNTENFNRWASGLPMVNSLSSLSNPSLLEKGFVTTVFKGVRGRNFDTFKDRNMSNGVPRDSYGRDVSNRKDPNFFVSDVDAADSYARAGVKMSDDVKKVLKEKKAYSFGKSDMYYIKSENPAVLTKITNKKVRSDIYEFWEKNIKDEYADDYAGKKEYKGLVEYDFDAFVKMVEDGRFLEPNMDKKDMYFAINKKYAESEQLGHWNDIWLDFSKFLLEKGYDSVVVNDNTVSKKSPTIIIDQGGKNVKASSNYGEFSKDDIRFNFQPAEQWKSETTSVGQVIKNTAGWVIIKATNKYRLYSPTHALIGIYNDPEQAKRKARASK